MKELFDMKYDPPTLSMILLECVKLGLPEIEGRKFHAYYEANGWMVGRNKMKSWTAALTHWSLLWKDNVQLKKRSVYELSKIMEAKQKLRDELKRRFSHETATGIQWDNEQSKARYYEFGREIKQLNAQIAEMK